MTDLVTTRNSQQRAGRIAPVQIAPSVETGIRAGGGVGGVPNLATAFLAARRETVEDWDGVCGELVDSIIGTNDDILHVEGDIAWRYHMVALIGGLIHDAWCEGPALPVRDWLAKMFADAIMTVALNGDDIYTGPADEFSLGGGGAELVTKDSGDTKTKPSNPSSPTREEKP